MQHARHLCVVNLRVEPPPLDHALLDATRSERLFGTSTKVGRQIKHRIRKELKLTASVGVASNKFAATISIALKKLISLAAIEPGEIQAILDPLPVGWL